jgi:glutathione S-transferase
MSVTLHKFLPAWDLPDLSPFCAKVETYLRLAGAKFETKLGDPRKAPKGKLPFIEHEGRTIADSTAIIAYLEEKLGAPLDAGLGAKERAATEAYRAMLDEHYYWVLVNFRWKEDAGWAVNKPEFVKILGAAGIPGFARGFVGERVRAQMIKQLHTQGTGRHTTAEIAAIGARQLDSLSEWLGDSPYFFGDSPRTIDASVYAFLNGTLGAAVESPVKEHARSKKNLVAYVERVKSKHFAA